jgi:hypothetical protein
MSVEYFYLLLEYKDFNTCTLFSKYAASELASVLDFSAKNDFGNSDKTFLHVLLLNN